MKIIKFLFNIFSTVAKAFAIVAVVNLVFSYVEEFIHRKKPEGGHYYNWKHGKIFYHKRGRGTPLILLHSFDPSSSGKDIMSLSQHLSSNHTVYSIDLLGFGLSDKPWIVYTNFLYVLLIQDFIRDVIGDITDIVACEESGLFALQALRLDSEMIGKVVILNPCYQEKISASSPQLGVILKKVIDFPIFGSFLYNLYSLTKSAPFDKDGRHVFTSRIAGYLTSDLSAHKELLSDDIVVFQKSSNSSFTFGDIKDSLL